MTTQAHPVPERAGLLLDVLRSAGPDFTNNGITRRHNTLLLVGTTTNHNPHVEPLPHINERVFGPGPGIAPVALRLLRNGVARTVHLVPARWDDQRGEWRIPDGGFMAGGNYATTGDSRGSDIVQRTLGYPFYGAVSVHDRQER